MSFPAYPSYEGTTVEWLSEVPIHWGVVALKRIVSLRSGEAITSEEIAETGDYPVFGGNGFRGYTSSFTHEGIYALIGRQGALCGNINYGTGRFWASEHALVASPVKKIEPKWLGELLRSMNLNQYSISAAQPGLAADALGSLAVPLPPFDEQASIAAFLDRETAKIDALVEEQRRLIALLKEKRQAVISHAVTKGLNPDAPTKDSGFEWLGDVPAHWDVRPIKTTLRGIKQGWSPQCHAEPVDSFDFWGVLKVGCVNGGHFNPAENKALPLELEPLPELAVRAGDVLVSRANTRDLVGSAALVESDYERLLLSDKLYCLDVDRDQIDPGFLALYLQADAARAQIEVAATGASSSMLNIGQAVIREMPIAKPSLEEQREILVHVKQRRVAFSSLVAEASDAIALLNERRAALISAAVSGKIDVRGSAKVLPFPVDRARARRLIAAEIIDRSAHQATFGRTKLQKLLYLVEAHANVNELAGRYVRMPYGPLDQDMIDEIEGAAADMGFAVDDSGNRKMVRYRPVAARGRSRGELAEWLGDDRVAKLDKLITDFADLDTRAAEAVATLYAVWNDALIDGETPSDDWIVNGFLTAWNKTKAENFDRHELPHRLGWMRRHGLVPKGAGPKTGIGGLFA